MSSLPKRFFSAAFIVIFLLATFYFFSSTGLIVVGMIIIFAGAIEYYRLTLARLSLTKFVYLWFLGSCLVIMNIALFFPFFALQAIGIIFSTYIVGLLWQLRTNTENEKLLSAIAFSVLGIIYAAILPVFALLILTLPNGKPWFLFLLVIVFAGDVAAYFGGILLGQKKLMPNVSPNKTIVGAYSGALGSVLAGLLVAHFGLKTTSPILITILSLGGTILAQSGDLFESLIKRVAKVKDSGQFMPGHGGVLDRLDGIYFAAPLIYFAAMTLNN